MLARVVSCSITAVVFVTILGSGGTRCAVMLLDFEGILDVALFSFVQGVWDRGVPSTFGVHTTASGNMYMGEWVDGMREGVGCELSGDGDWYRGEFHEDAMTGLVASPSTHTYVVKH